MPTPSSSRPTRTCRIAGSASMRAISGTSHESGRLVAISTFASTSARTMRSALAAPGAAVVLTGPSGGAMPSRGVAVRDEEADRGLDVRARRGDELIERHDLDPRIHAVARHLRTHARGRDAAREEDPAVGRAAPVPHRGSVAEGASPRRFGEAHDAGA